MGKHLNVCRHFLCLSHPGPEQAVCRRALDGTWSSPCSRESLRRQEAEPERRQPQGMPRRHGFPAPPRPYHFWASPPTFSLTMVLPRVAPGEAGGPGRDVWRPGPLIIQNAFTLCYLSYLFDISLKARLIGR